MNDILSPTAQKIQTILDRLGYKCEVIEYQETTRTSIDAAAQVGCTLGQIVKSLIFIGKKSGEPILILTSGANRVDTNKISNLIGEKIDRADPEFVRSKTGYSIGGIPPLGHHSLINTLIDEDLLKYDQIWAAAGTPNAVFRLTPQDLKTMSSGKVVSVKEE